jgi:hypothetical protein
VGIPSNEAADIANSDRAIKYMCRYLFSSQRWSSFFVVLFSQIGKIIGLIYEIVNRGMKPTVHNGDHLTSQYGKNEGFLCTSVLDTCISHMAAYCSVNNHFFVLFAMLF